MKRLLIFITLATLMLGSCREKKTETKVIREVQVEKVETPAETPPNEGILERAAKKVDNKVNEEIDKKIDEID